MSSPSLQNKTVRPGSLLGYSYYYSKQARKGSKKPPVAKRRLRLRVKLFVMLLVIIAGTLLVRADTNTKNVAKLNEATKATTIPKIVHTQSAPAPKVTPTVAPAVVTPPPSTACSGNTLDELVVVSISQRHMWACNQSTQVYDSPVVTGISYLAADLTPTGTYHIYAKETDQQLTGSDSTGSWNDFVYYWMPFLHNQYGNYGFHDATWRAASDFGNISPDSANASHGCVELPLATAKWLYNWSYVGTTITIES